MIEQARCRATVLVEISPGELLDRLSILRLKAERIRAPEIPPSVRRELDALDDVRQRLAWPEGAALLAEELQDVNAALWDVEDALRRHESRSDFGPRFIELARSVYRLNDRRAALKRRVNELCRSELGEVKSYAR